jgi:hypothetical protein
MTEGAYGACSIKRSRRTKAEVADVRDAIRTPVRESGRS